MLAAKMAVNPPIKATAVIAVTELANMGNVRAVDEEKKQGEAVVLDRVLEQRLVSVTQDRERDVVD